MIYILKFLLIFLLFASSVTFVYIFKQHKTFLSSEESNETSMLNKIFINFIAVGLYIFMGLISGFCVYFILQKIII